MKTARMWLGLILISGLAILILNSAGVLVPGKKFDGTGSYVILGVVVFAVMRFLQLPTMAYFAKPRFGWQFAVAMLLSVNLVVVALRGEPFDQLGMEQWVRGVIFLLAVGVTEEILSRGVVFGVLLRHGLPIAAIGSSVMFGLMHINSYIGNWDLWRVYWHVTSAAAFGLFACALLVVTRSIWVPILFHSLSNVGLLFSTPPTEQERATPVSIDVWEGLVYPLAPFLTFVIPALFLFWINAGTPVPTFIERLAIKWGLAKN